MVRLRPTLPPQACELATVEKEMKLRYHPYKYKRPEIPVSEQSRRKREKNQKRAQARRLARVPNVIAESEGSEGRGDCASPSLLADDDGHDQGLAPLRPPTVQSSGAPIACLLMFSPESQFASLESSGLLVPSAPPTGDAHSLRLTLDPAFRKEEDFLDLSVSSHCPDFGIITTDPVWNDKKRLSSLTTPDLEVMNEAGNVEMTCNTPAIIQPIRKSLNTIRPSLASQAPLDASTQCPSVRKSRSLDDAAVGSSRPPFRQEDSSSQASSFILNDLDLSRYSTMSSSTISLTRNSLSGPALGAYQFPARQPICTGVDIDANGPPNFLGCSLSSGAQLAPAPSVNSLSGTPATLGTPETKSPPPSCNSLLLPMAGISAWALNPAAASVDLDQDWGTYSSDELDVIDINDLFYNARRQRRTTRMNYPINSTQCPCVHGEENTPIFDEHDPRRIVKEHHRLQDLHLSQTVDDHEFSINNVKTPKGMPCFDRTFANQNFRSTVNSLAPEAQNKKLTVSPNPTRQTVDEMDQDTLRENLKTRISDSPSHIQAAIVMPLPLAQPVIAAKYKDAPLSPRSGIVPPVSMPASSPRLFFAMEMSNPPWSGRGVLPAGVAPTAKPEDGRTAEGGFIMSALKWVYTRILDYFWHREG